MATDRTSVIELQLSNGAKVLAEVRTGDREEEVAWRALKLGEITGSIKGLVEDLTKPLSAAKCDKLILEFGLDLAVDQGTLTSLLVNASATASIKVSMEWSREVILSQNTTGTEG